MIIFECHIIDIAPTISRLLNVPMIPPTGKPIPEVLKYAKKKDYKRVVIIIVDSLGYSLCMKSFSNNEEFERACRERSVV